MIMDAKFSFLVFVLCLAVQYGSCKNLTKTLLTDKPKGAMCLDGSPPGYFMRPGTGTGAKKWILHLMGGGWCATTADCYNRSSTIYGSSTKWPESHQLFGFFSDDSTVNPDFYNWNAVFLMYCDGGSFAGDVEEPDVYNNTKLYYRGYRILTQLISHLKMEKGLTEATDVILTGCSAGGLAVYLHADHVRGMIQHTAKYKAFADAGYFIDIPDVNGSNAFPDSFTSLLKLQKIDAALSHECKAKYHKTDPKKCLLAPYIYGYIKTPIFVLNSQYDAVVLNYSYGQPCLPPNCTEEGKTSFQHYENVFNQQIQPVLESPKTNGYFLDSCFIHCQSFESDLVWSKYAIKGRTIAQTLGDWYFERSTTNTRLKDCEDYPCNPSCSTVPKN